MQGSAGGVGAGEHWRRRCRGALEAYVQGSAGGVGVGVRWRRRCRGAVA